MKQVKFRFRFKFSDGEKWIPTAWYTNKEGEAYEMAEKHRGDKLSQVYSYDLSSAI